MRVAPICNIAALGLAPFAVSMLDAAHAEFRADKGLVTVAAAIVSGNDFTTGAWGKTLCAGTTAHEIICDNDLGTPHLHIVNQTISGIQTNHSARVVIDLKAGTTLTYVLTEVGTAYVSVNLTTGVTSVVSGIATVESCVASPDLTYAWRLTYVGDPGPGNNVAIYPSTSMAVAGATFAATGTESIKAAVVSVTQVNVSEADDTLGRFSAAVVKDSNDISTANWSRTGCPASTANTLVEDNSNGTHVVVQTIAGLNVGRPGIFRARIRPQGRDYVRVDDGTEWCSLRLSTHATISTAGMVLAGANDLGGGLYEYTFSVASVTTAQIRFYSSPDGTTFSFVGASAAAFDIYAIDAPEPIAIFQTTAASRPALEQDSAGRFYLRGDGVNDFLSGKFAGMNQPDTALGTFQYDAAFVAGTAFLFSGYAVLTGDLYRYGATSMSFTAGTNLTWTSAETLALRAWAGQASGTTSLMYSSGRLVAGPGNGGATAYDGATILCEGGAGANPAAAKCYHAAWFDGEVALCHHARYQNMARKRWGAVEA
jgi:hypothetical protein